MESVKENIDLNTLESLLPDSGSESTKAATSEESLISGGKASYFPIDDTLGKITVKILSSEKDGDHATVKAECTAVDLTEFLKGYMQKSMENALDFTKDDAAKDAALNQYAADYLAQEDVPMKTTTVDIQLVKADQTWKITSTTPRLDGRTAMNLPNKLTILRIILVPFFVLFMLLSGDIFPHHNLVALAIFGIASYTDHLDGKIARRDHLITNFGKLMDPWPIRSW